MHWARDGRVGMYEAGMWTEKMRWEGEGGETRGGGIRKIGTLSSCIIVGLPLVMQCFGGVD